MGKMKDDNKISYTQCYWHANGELKCKRVTVPYNQNQSNDNLQFNSFSEPNENYKPNEYRKNFDYYEQPPPKMCGLNCSNEENNLENQYISPSRDFEIQKYLNQN